MKASKSRIRGRGRSNAHGGSWRQQSTGSEYEASQTLELAQANRIGRGTEGKAIRLLTSTRASSSEECLCRTPVSGCAHRAVTIAKGDQVRQKNASGRSVRQQGANAYTREVTRSNQKSARQQCRQQQGSQSKPSSQPVPSELPCRLLYHVSAGSRAVQQTTQRRNR